ncbi:MAG TPA: hypothetical protein ENO03_09450 [Candidatus Aminicenantes bacterium]|nr:hypothetical protein [Candidatus Aminicenantes bacterium]HDT14558.1 hypothetical protein [Candidatus Aminicenantes bacterium]
MTSTFMSLKDALATIADAREPVLLRSADIDWEAKALLDSLPERKLGQRVQYMPGFYIAAVSESMCLGEVLYRIKKKTA